jgi:hypothetical protein
MRVGARVGLLSKRPVMMMVESRKVMEKQPFASIPQQSDYVTTWSQTERTPPVAKARGLLRRLFVQLPMS